MYIRRIQWTQGNTVGNDMEEFAGKVIPTAPPDPHLYSQHNIWEIQSFSMKR